RPLPARGRRDRRRRRLEGGPRRAGQAPPISGRKEIKMDRKEIKMYSDYKSPFAYLAFDPGFALEERYQVRVRWIPFQLRIKGKGERSVYSEYKVKYSYLDARRWAKPRGIYIKGPKKIYDTTPALIGGLFAARHDRLLDYSRKVYESFFRGELEADQPEPIAQIIA